MTLLALLKTTERISSEVSLRGIRAALLPGPKKTISHSKNFITTVF